MIIEQSEWRRGWKVLIGASVGTAISYGLFLMTAGLFIIPMQEEFGWSRSAVSIGPIVGLLAAAMAPFGGVVIDRFGARPIAITGLVGLGAMYVLLSFTPASQFYLYAVVAIMAVFATISSGVIYCAGVVTWFRRNSGLAIGITMSGLSLTAALAIPALASLIENYGWRMGYLALCAVTWVIGLPFVVGWFHEASQPAGSGQSTEAEKAGESATISRKGGMDFRTAARDKRFWLCIAAFGTVVWGFR